MGGGLVGGVATTPADETGDEFEMVVTAGEDDDCCQGGTGDWERTLACLLLVAGDLTCVVTPPADTVPEAGPDLKQQNKQHQNPS